MKKYLKILLIIIVALTLCSCKNKKEEELFAIEVTGNEFDTNFYKKEGTYILASYNPKMSNSKEFIENLNKLGKELSAKIYYYDITPTINDAIFFLSTNTDIDISNNIFMVIKDGDLDALSEYETYEQMKDILANYEVTDDFTFTTKEEKEESLNKAKESFNKGDISNTLKYISESWILEESKELFNNNEVFKIINTWLSTKTIDKKNYQEIMFSKSDNVCVISSYTEKELKKNKPSKIKFYDYLIKDGIIYLSDSDSQKAINSYKIKDLSSEKLVLEDNKTNKTIEYKRKD